MIKYRFDKFANPGQIYEFCVRPNWLDATLTVISPNTLSNIATEVPRGLWGKYWHNTAHQLTEELDYRVKNHQSPSMTNVAKTAADQRYRRKEGIYMDRKRDYKEMRCFLTLEQTTHEVLVDTRVKRGPAHGSLR